MAVGVAPGAVLSPSVVSVPGPGAPVCCVGFLRHFHPPSTGGSRGWLLYPAPTVAWLLSPPAPFQPRFLLCRGV